MALNPDYVLAHRFAQQTAAISSAEGLLYAVALGLGSDPAQPHELRYVYEEGQVLFPTIAVLPGHPGNWMEDARAGITRSMVMHGGQEIILHRAIQIDETLHIAHRVAGLVDKGAGRSAILLLRREITDATGAAVATLNSTVVCRADGGFGGSQGGAVPDVPKPAGGPAFSVELPIGTSAALLYRLCGDRNPLHVDPERARRAGFARPPLHGLCAFGMAARAVLNHCADGDSSALRRIGVSFAAPLFPGETLVIDIWRGDGAVLFRGRVPGREKPVLDNGIAEIA